MKGWAGARGCTTSSFPYRNCIVWLGSTIIFLQNLLKNKKHFYMVAVTSQMQTWAFLIYCVGELYLWVIPSVLIGLFKPGSMKIIFRLPWLLWHSLKLMFVVFSSALFHSSLRANKITWARRILYIGKYM